MTVGEGLRHIRTVAREKESIYACYVMDPAGKLLGSVSLRDLVMADVNQPLTSVMRKKPVTRGEGKQRTTLLANFRLLPVPQSND